MPDAAATTRPPRWSVDVRDLTGRRALVTGASDGVGVEIARGLARAGAEVVMPVRSKAKGVRARDLIREDAGAGSVTLRSLDLSSLASTRALGRQLIAEGAAVDIVVLNAGIVLLNDPVRHLSVDGIELHLQTNMLSHALLIADILPLLRARGARVVLQCSLAARYGAIAWDDPNLDRRYRPLRAYAASKVALGLFGVELGRRSEDLGWGVESVLCHPGTAMTHIAPASMRERRTAVSRIVGGLYDRGVGLQSPAEAALPALYAATSPGVRSGDFVAPSGLLELAGPPALRPLYRRLTGRADASRAWDLVGELTGARFPGGPPAPAHGDREGDYSSPGDVAWASSSSTMRRAGVAAAPGERGA
ncbi:SDR family oxidoreductase [Microbacter sp. GSS18]|nr:SDR family oxidoreductase [Microbacter sp. GSS18]